MFYSSRFTLVFLLFLGLFFTSCSFFREPTVFEKAVQSKSGAIAEALLPQDVLFSVSVNYLSSGQKGLYEALLGKFSKYEFVQNVFKDFINRELEPFGILVDPDLKNIIGENSRFVFTVAGSSQNESDKRLFYYLNVYLSRPENFGPFYDKLKKSGLFVEENYGGALILTESSKSDTSLYLFRIKDLLLIGNGFERAKNMIDMDRSQSLIARKYFERITAKLTEPHIAFIYIDYGNLAKYLKFSSGKNDLDEKKYLSFNDFEAYGISIQSQNQGFKLRSSGILKSGVSIENQNRYLYRDFPGRDILVLIEGFNLQSLLKGFFNLLSAQSSEFEAIYSFLRKSFKEVTARDFENDFLSWMNKGYLLSLQNNGNKIIPGLSLLIDASSNPEQAKEFFKRLDAQIEEYIQSIKKKYEPAAEAIVKEKILIDGANFSMVEVDFNKLKLKDMGTGFMAIPLSLFSENAILYYGMTLDNRFVISTYQKFQGDYKIETTASNDNFQNLQNYLSDAKNSLTYVDFGEISRYLETITNFYDKLGYNSTATKLRIGLNFIKDDLKAIKGIIWANKIVDNYLVGEGMVRIGE